MTQSSPGEPSASAAVESGATGGRGAPRRVAEVHAQTRRGLFVAAGFAAAAVVAALAGSGWWVALHLFAVGGLLSAISATTQMLAVTWSTAPPPNPLVAGAQRWTLASGAVALVAGRDSGRQWLFATGGALVIAAILALAPILVQVRRRAVTDRFAPAMDAYAGAVVAGAIGMSFGLVVGTGHAGTRAAELRGAHLVLNIFGLVGLVIAGTLPYFAATQLRSKMSPRATPATMRLTFLALGAATAVAAAGKAFDRPPVAAAGLVAYAVGLVSVSAMLPVYAKGRLVWAGPRAVQLLAGLAWWAAMTVALALASMRDHADDGAVLRALVIGGFAQILVASLAYLGPVLRGGGHQRLTAGFAVTRSWVSPAAGNVAAGGALARSGLVLAVALAVWAADVATRAARLLAGARGRGPAGRGAGHT